MTYFNGAAWRDFSGALAHQCTFDTDRGYLAIQGGPQVTLIRCKCGESKWFFREHPEEQKDRMS